MISTENYLSYIVRTRRTVHKFRPDKIDESLIWNAVDIGRWAPNHKLTEPWRVLLIDDATAEKIVSLNTRLVREKRGEQSAAIKEALWSAVPNWFAVTTHRSPDPVRYEEDYAATCCFAHNISLFLWTKKIGVKWTTGAVTRSSELYELLEVDEANEKIVGLFWYGYPAEVKPSSRKPTDQIIFRSGD